ncbi:MAG: hypothetical protein LBT12_01495, partial [Oscillospiraceae bacterium]|nr:hypothetical protein [Oscillospiraceae bacterium]
MQDRQSMFPDRVQLIPVEGQENTFDMIQADMPTVIGTSLDKATLLSDTVAAKFALSGDAAIPSNALDKLAGAAGNYRGTCSTAE